MPTTVIAIPAPFSSVQATKMKKAVKTSRRPEATDALMRISIGGPVKQRIPVTRRGMPTSREGKKPKEIINPIAIPYRESRDPLLKLISMHS